MSWNLQTVMRHLRALIEGTWQGGIYQIPAGRFLPTDKRTPLESYPASGSERRYELLWKRVRDGQAESDESNVTGNIVDAFARLELRIAYHTGGGTMDAADRDGVNDAAAIDWHYIRRRLVEAQNYDAQNTGIENVRVNGDAVAPEQKPGADVAVMVIPVTAQYLDRWTEEPE